MYVDQEDVISAGILTGELPLLQAYLQDRWGAEGSTKMHQIVETGLQQALGYLQQRSLPEACAIFANLVSSR